MRHLSNGAKLCDDLSFSTCHVGERTSLLTTTATVGLLQKRAMNPFLLGLEMELGSGMKTLTWTAQLAARLGKGDCLVVIGNQGRDCTYIENRNQRK